MSATRSSLLGVVCVCLLSLVGMLGGCAGRAERFDIVVRPDADVVASPTRPVEVDLVGVTPEQEAAWGQVSMTEYFLPGSAARAEVMGAGAVRMVFGPGQTSPQKFAKSDPAWSGWDARHARKLMVVANLPGGRQDQPGSLDDRRLFISLERSEWETAAGGAIEIRLRSTRVTARPQTE